MLNFCLNAVGFSGEELKLILYYGIILAVIAATVLLMGVFRRKTKGELRPEKMKKACVKAKKYAEEILASGEDGARVLLGATKLAMLSKHIANAAWYGFQIVSSKKDIVIEGIANALDGVATTLHNEAEDGYVPTDVYESVVKKAISVLDENIAKLDGIIGK